MGNCDEHADWMQGNSHYVGCWGSCNHICTWWCDRQVCKNGCASGCGAGKPLCELYINYLEVPDMKINFAKVISTEEISSMSNPNEIPDYIDIGDLEYFSKIQLDKDLVDDSLRWTVGSADKSEKLTKVLAHIFNVFDRESYLKLVKFDLETYTYYILHKNKKSAEMFSKLIYSIWHS